MPMNLVESDIPSLTHDELTEHLRLARVNPGHYQHSVAALEQELAARSPTVKYRCFKCGHERHQLHELRAAQSFWSAFFNLQSARYSAVVCQRCKFAEFYHGDTPVGQQVADVLLGN